jgi:hypothetical protein
METFFILLIFGGVPLAIFSLIILGAVLRARRQRAIGDAAAKYLKS